MHCGKRVLRAIVVLAIACVACVTPSSAHAEEVAAGDITYIRSFSDLLAEVLASRTQDTSNAHYVLDLADAPNKTLDLTSDQVDQIVKQIGSLTFGSKDNPFKGTFDGNGYTIKGLNYERDLFIPAPDTGLFAWTDGATIKNINFTDAYVGADYRGGVIVGCAKNTTLEHIKLTNCTSSVTPANNSVSLITNAGLAGGMVAGEMENCMVYDVEVQGGRVINNSTVAVSGLGGEGLYLGAIAGVAHNTNIEYCRVTPVREKKDDGTIAYHYTEVHNKYDVAVGALAGQAVYSGGIAGSMYGNSSNMIDCFSTADCYTYAATYVSVGAGNVGYVGGLIARTDDAVHVVRSHYAGNLHSYLYNALLVIPIIQEHEYLGGLVEWDHDSGVTITNSYFKPSVSQNNDGGGKDIPSIFNNGHHDKVYAGATFGPKDDAAYVDRSFWEGADFDFAGGAERTTAYMGGAPHVNKWIMDYDLGIPVHGDSVKATFDFPGAGTATIGASDVIATQAPQATDDPYEFAVQGFVPSDFDMEFSMDVNAVSAEHTPAVSDTAHNGGYRFNGWYREPDVTVDRIDASHAFFDPILAGNKTPVSTDAVYTASNTGPGTAEGFAGGDLFVAYCQGQVLFHDIKGSVIDLKGAANPDTSDDWYNHEAVVPEAAEPQADRVENGVGQDAVLLGWTWLPRAASSEDGIFGYPSVTASQLGDIQKAGAFVKPGDPIVQPMDLYPIYADYASNIVTQFEGNEQDASDDFTLREGVGRTDVVKKDDGYAIRMVGALDNGALPDGYRFLGWYEVFEDGTSTRVSQKEEYVLPASVDLTQKHTYEARFEYRVEYSARHVKADDGSDHNRYEVLDTRWQPYKSAFEPIDLKEFGSFHNVVFKHWSANAECAGDDAVDIQQIVEPLDAYAHLEEGQGHSWDIVLRNDFPGSGVFHSQGRPDNPLINPYEFWIEPAEGYRFWFWDGERSDGTRKLDAHQKWGDHDMNRGQAHEYTAHMTADVVFHGVPGGDKTVNRRYESDIFKVDPYSPMEDFSYGLSGDHIDSQQIKDVLGARAPEFVGAPSPTIDEMKREGYVFLGWIDGTAGSETEKDGAVWKSIYDVVGDSFCTTNVTHALSYMVPQDAVTTRPTDLYPVYAKYDYTVTTNIKRAGVPEGSGINVPADPEHRATASNQDFTQDVLFTADTKTTVTGGGDAYKLVSWTIERSDGATRLVTETDAQGRPGAGTPVSNENASLVYAVEPGYSYTFVANYAPLAVLYHTAEGKTDVVIRNEGDMLGKAPEGAPAFDAGAIDAALQGSAVFMGWTEQKPAQGEEWLAWPADGAVDFVDEHTTVKHAMELFPVYRAAGITVNSNIDHLIEAAGENPADYRSVKHEGLLDLKLWAQNYGDYEFVGWYKNYDLEGEKGIVTDQKEHLLEKDALFAGDVYTAVFRRSHEVRYHGIDGQVLFTAYAPDASDGGVGRTFVSTIQQPDGTTVDVPIDSAAWTAIMEQLDTQQGKDYCELFDSWQWVKDGKDPVLWEQFCKQTIVEDMDLYPVTRQVRSFFSEKEGDATKDTVNTNDLLWALDSNAETPVKAYFKEPYARDNLSVNVQRVSYTPGADGVTQSYEPLSGRNVALFASQLSIDPMGSKPTGKDGTARFEFNSGLTITKSSKDAAAAGATYSFTLKNVTTHDERTVLVQLSTDAGQDGAYTGSVNIDVPVGRYELIENASWAWRYDAQVTVNGGVNDPARPGAVTFDVGMERVSATCENKLVRTGWVDGQATKVNEFNSQGAASQGGR